MARKEKLLLTEGPIAWQVIRFAMPLLFGNIFQQLYNTVDSVVVGNYIGKEALGAVGSSGSLIHMLVNLFMGVSVGAGVVIARYKGAGDHEGVKKAVHTNVAFGLAVSMVLTVVGVLLTPVILGWMGTPEEILPNSIKYLRIYFMGISTNVMYNIGSSIYRAVGDSTRPLIFLIVSSIVNMVLDVVFIKYMHMGVEGVAIATIIAQFTSCLLTFGTLMRVNDDYRVEPKRIRFHGEELKEIIRIGLPSGLQNSIVSFSNVMVQTNINSFGDIAVAGCGAYSKVDGFALMPSGSFAMSVTTFVSQNIGAGKYERAKKGGLFGIAAGMLSAQVMGVLIYFFAPSLIGVFNDDPRVIEYGTMMARNIVFGYFLVAFSHGMGGMLRGAGRAKAPMYIMVGFWCILRITWMTVMVKLTNDIRVVFWAYPITWTCSTIALLLYYKKTDWLHTYKAKNMENGERSGAEEQPAG